jgi:hypothetical protein
MTVNAGNATIATDGAIVSSTPAESGKAAMATSVPTDVVVS